MLFTGLVNDCTKNGVLFEACKVISLNAEHNALICALNQLSTNVPFVHYSVPDFVMGASVL
jgi:hypothetical protein